MLREFFWSEFHFGTELVQAETKHVTEDNVVFHSGTEVSRDNQTEEANINLQEEKDLIALDTEDLEEMAIDIEFPDAVNVIEPIDTNSLLDIFLEFFGSFFT